MTKEEVNKIPFRFATHLSMEHEHCSTYTAEYNGHQFAMCKHTPYKDGVPKKGKGYTHYMVDGKVFKTLEKFYEYCETIK